MPATDTREVFGYLLCMITAISMFLYMFFIIMQDCAAMAIPGSGSVRCGTGTGVYVFGGAFIGIALYAGYNMSRILFPARFR